MGERTPTHLHAPRVVEGGRGAPRPGRITTIEKDLKQQTDELRAQQADSDDAGEVAKWEFLTKLINNWKALGIIAIVIVLPALMLGSWLTGYGFGGSWTHGAFWFGPAPTFDAVETTPTPTPEPTP